MGNQDKISTTKKTQVMVINNESIELFKILKIQDLASTGGHAKFIIAEGLVQVNGKIETRKRKKIFNGDVVEFDGEKIFINTK